MDETKKEFAITDGCMWEKNLKEGTQHTHAIEVMDVETGQIKYIRGGSIIKFISGNITKARDQEDYNKINKKNGK